MCNNNMNNFAEHIIAVANNNSYGITNLQLQKIMYFAIIDGISEGIITSEFVENFYDEDFEAWLYGPVIPSVYRFFKKYGATYIIEHYELKSCFNCLNDIINNLLQVKAFDLVDESHTHRLWKNNKETIMEKRINTGIKYSLEDLIFEGTHEE